MNGFRQYINVGCTNYMPTEPLVVESSAPTKVDSMLDLIYAVDPVTGFPSGAISQYLSDKTNDQVRKFIEDNILHAIDNGSHDYPANLRDEVLKLDSEFIAKTSRNRYESLEDYEARVKSYFDDLEQDKEYRKRLSILKKKYSKKNED